MKLLLLAFAVALVASSCVSSSSEPKKIARFLVSNELSGKPAEALFKLASWVRKGKYGLVRSRSFEKDIQSTIDVKCVYMSGQMCTDQCIDIVKTAYSGPFNHLPRSSGELMHLLDLASHEQALNCQKDFQMRVLTSKISSPGIESAVDFLRKLERTHQSLELEKRWNSFADIAINNLFGNLADFAYQKSLYEQLKKTSIESAYLEAFRQQDWDLVRKGHLDDRFPLVGIHKAQQAFLLPACGVIKKELGDEFERYSSMIGNLRSDEKFVYSQEFFDYYGMYSYCKVSLGLNNEHEIGKLVKSGRLDGPTLDRHYKGDA